MVVVVVEAMNQYAVLEFLRFMCLMAGDIWDEKMDDQCFCLADMWLNKLCLQFLYFLSPVWLAHCHAWIFFSIGIMMHSYKLACWFCPT